MDKEPEPWINTPAFNWTPEVPLRAEPRFMGAAIAEEEFAEPRFEKPDFKPFRPDPVAPGPMAPGLVAPDPIGPDPIVIVVTAPPATEEEQPLPRFIPAAAEPETAAAPPAFLPRMAVGLAQGAALLALFTDRGWLDPYAFAALLMVALFAPLLLLAGLGRMGLRPLLIWTLGASVLLAAAGAYHHWRTLSSDGGHPGLALITLASLFLFVGQSLAEAKAGDYPAHCRSAWRLSIRIVLCAIAAGLAWAAAGAASGWVRERYPLLQFAPLIVPLVTVSTALAAQLTGQRLLAILQAGLMFVLILALPFVLLLGAAITGLAALGQWQPSIGVTGITAMLLVLGINASYGDGTGGRPYWRKRLELSASLLLVPLTAIAAFALATRVQQYGWSDNRIFVVAGLLLMGGYAVCYAASALVSLGGGGWMQRIENSNLALAFAALALITVLASPLADPARLAVQSQIYRLDHHQVGADTFDFTWLRDHGLRFGHDALARMAAAQDRPQLARGAFAALSAPPPAERPAPTEIGANIHVHSEAGLPAGLLARDWSEVAGAPPCLASAAMTCDAFFADLDGDGRDEILLAYGSDARWWASVMKQGIGGGWYVAGTLAAPPCPGSLTTLRSGQFAITRPAGNWRDLMVDGMRLSVERPKPPTACPFLR